MSADAAAAASAAAAAAASASAAAAISSAESGAVVAKKSIADGGADGAVTPVKPGAGGAPTLGEETLDPSKKPADGGKNNTSPDVPKPAKNPKAPA